MKDYYEIRMKTYDDESNVLGYMRNFS